MPGGESSRRSLAMHIHVAEFWVRLFLHEVMAYLVDQLKLAAEHVAECFRNLLEDA